MFRFLVLILVTGEMPSYSLTLLTSVLLASWTMLLGVVHEYCSECPFKLFWTSASEFTNNPPPQCRNLLLLVVNISMLASLSVALRKDFDDMLPDESFGIEYQPSALFQILDLKNSAPGSLQHASTAGLANLPLDTAKSSDISSRATSKPCTRVSKEFSPLWELPINL